MRVITKGALRDYWQNHADAETPLLDWYEQVRTQDWGSPQEVKEFRGDASILKGGRVVFNIKGNDYRLVVHIHYKSGLVYIRFIGTHAEYDKIDAETI